jgi:hypothetical protein
LDESGGELVMIEQVFSFCLGRSDYWPFPMYKKGRCDPILSDAKVAKFEA